MQECSELIDTKVGRLTIKKYLGFYKTVTTKVKQHWFECDCDCGETGVIKGYNYLYYGLMEVKSCGCWNVERTQNFNRRTKTGFTNKYIRNEDDSYTIFCSRKHNKELKEYEVIVDENFFEFLKNHNRKIQIDSRGYAFITRPDSKRQLFIHNLVIFGFDYYDKNMNTNVDHIITNKITDNRKSNLRPADDFENTQNAKRRVDNTCGIKGFSIRISNRPTVHIVVRIQSYKDRIQRVFILSPEGLREAITWNYNKRKELHNDFSNFGFDIENKTLEDIIEEQSQIFIDNLTEEQKKPFLNNGYIYKPIKNKPRYSNVAQ